MKEYKVGLFYEASGYSYIKANSQEEANEKGLAELNEKGEDVIQDVQHRDYFNV